MSGNVLKEGFRSDKRAAERADFDKGGTTMRRLENYVRKYGPEFGPVLYHVLQSQAAHAGVSARLRRKIHILSGKTPAAPSKVQTGESESLPLFPETGSPESAEQAAAPEDAELLQAAGA
jgi:hypothetical protein